MKDERLRTLERRAAALHGSEIPSALIRYRDGTSKAVRGFDEGCNAALSGEVESIVGDDADYTALLRALSGTI